MKKRIIRELLAVILAAALFIGVLPMHSFFVSADEEPSHPPAPVFNQIDNKGGTIYYKGETPVNNPGDTIWGGDVDVSLLKEVKATANENEFEIKLQVQTKTFTTTTQVAADASVVLVIDVSGSMGFSPKGYSTQYSTEFSVPLNADGTPMTRVNNAGGNRYFSGHTIDFYIGSAFVKKGFISISYM